MLIGSNAQFTIDGQSLIHSCLCGGTEFHSNALLHFRTCQVIRCDRCGQMRTFPEPNPDALKEIYSQDSSKYSLTNLEDTSQQVMWDGFANGILSAVGEFTSPPGRLLDVGCNFGNLLFPARHQGYEAEGLEINQENAKYLQQQGFQIYTETIEKAAIPTDYFDVVVANQVLEHVPDPNVFLSTIQRILKPSGVLFIGVPCFWSPIPLILKRANWYALLPEEHIWQFSPRSLEHLLSKHHFSTVWTYRGCSEFWGNLSFHPKDIARWLSYRSVGLLGLGDFINVIVVNQKS